MYGGMKRVEATIPTSIDTDGNLRLRICNDEAIRTPELGNVGSYQDESC